MPFRTPETHTVCSQVYVVGLIAHCSGRRPGAPTRPFEHEVVLRGGAHDTRGSGGRGVQIGRASNQVAGGLFPGIDPQLAVVKPGNSVVMQFYPSDTEVDAARARRREEEQRLEREQSVPGEEAPEGDEEEGIGAGALPYTSLAMLVLADAVSREDPIEAGDSLRDVGVVAAESVKDFALTLADAGVELDLSRVSEGARAEPSWSLRLVEHLDAVAEVPPERVTSTGCYRESTPVVKGALKSSRKPPETCRQHSEGAPPETRSRGRSRPLPDGRSASGGFGIRTWSRRLKSSGSGRAVAFVRRASGC